MYLELQKDLEQLSVNLLFRYEGKVPDVVLLSLVVSKYENPFQAASFLEVPDESDLVHYYVAKPLFGKDEVLEEMRGWIQMRIKYGSGPEITARAPVLLRPNFVSQMVFLLEPLRLAAGDFAIVSLHPQVQLTLYSFLIRYE
jgi:hypothetical protein